MFLPQGLLSDRAGRPQVTPAAESGLVRDVEVWVQGMSSREVTQGRKLAKALGWLVPG